MEATEAQRVAYFQLQDGSPGRREIAISEVLAARPALIIGSDSRAHLQLSGEGIASAHAIVTHKSGAYIIQPRFPQNEVFVNETRVTGPKVLLPGDVVRIGAVTLRFQQEDGVPVAALAAVNPLAVARPTVQVQVTPVALPRSVTPKPLAARSVAPAASVVQNSSTEVYFPRSVAQPQTSSLGLSLAIGSIIAIVGIVAYALFAGAGLGVGTAAAKGDPLFAFNDGKATFVMFDADW
jgi:hypothetical protein